MLLGRRSNVTATIALCFCLDTIVLLSRYTESVNDSHGLQCVAPREAYKNVTTS